MDLRLCFENKAGINIDDEHVFRQYAENYLGGFPIEWGGSISISHTDKQTTNMEPLWQYLIRDSSRACRDYLCEYLEGNPMAGYFVHVFQNDRGTNAEKIF